MVWIKIENGTVTIAPPEITKTKTEDYYEPEAYEATIQHEVVDAETGKITLEDTLFDVIDESTGEVTGQETRIETQYKNVLKSEDVEYRITGYNLDSNSDMLLADGYQLVDDELYNLYSVGKAEIKSDVLVDITDTDEYKAKVAEQAAKEQAMTNITKRQLLIWLYMNKQKTEDDIYSAIETITDETQKYLAKVNYSGTNNFYYGNDFVALIGSALGLTTDELKTMFNSASSL